MAAPKPVDAPLILSQADRSVVGGRAVQIIIPQSQIETSIDAGRIARPPSGGLLDTLIVYSLNDKRSIMERTLRDKAEATVAPLRQALGGFDIDALAFAATKAALAKPEWFQPQIITIGRDPSPSGRAAFAGASATPQVAFVAYRYELSPDFSNIRVTAETTLANRATPSDKPLYRHAITSIVQLRAPSYEHRENVARWSADGGRLAKTALATAFKQIERLIPSALGLTQGDITAFSAKNREKAFAAGLYGPLIERSTDGSGAILIWSGGLTSVQTAN